MRRAIYLRPVKLSSSFTAHLPIRVCRTQWHPSLLLALVKSEYSDRSGQMWLLAQDVRQLLAHMCQSLMTSLSRCHMRRFARWEAGTEPSSFTNTWPRWQHGEGCTRADAHSLTGSCVGGDGWVFASSLPMNLCHGSPQKRRVNKMEKLQRSSHLLLWHFCLYSCSPAVFLSVSMGEQKLAAYCSDSAG